MTAKQTIFIKEDDAIFKAFNWLGRVLNQIKHENSKVEVFDISVSIRKTPKTYEQLKGFHGQILPQAIECHKNNGEIKTVIGLKEELKFMFLAEPVFNDNKEPVMIPLPDGEHIQAYKAPSLADLTIEKMHWFMEQVIAYYADQFQWAIIIDSELKAA